MGCRSTSGTVRMPFRLMPQDQGEAMLTRHEQIPAQEMHCRFPEHLFPKLFGNPNFSWGVCACHPKRLQLFRTFGASISCRIHWITRPGRKPKGRDKSFWWPSHIGLNKTGATWPQSSSSLEWCVKITGRDVLRPLHLYTRDTSLVHGTVVHLYDVEIYIDICKCIGAALIVVVWWLVAGLPW